MTHIHKARSSRKLLISAIYGLSFSIILRLGEFIISSPTSVFRNILLTPLTLIPYLIFGIALGIFIYKKKRVYSKLFITSGIMILLVSIFTWYLIQEPFLSGLLLPPATTK